MAMPKDGSPDDGCILLKSYGPEFTAIAVRERLEKVGAQMMFIEPGTPWESGDNGRFNRTLRDMLMNRMIFYT